MACPFGWSRTLQDQPVSKEGAGASSVLRQNAGANSRTRCTGQAEGRAGCETFASNSATNATGWTGAEDAQ